MSILVLGIGNVLLTDEGVGVRAVRELARRYTFSGEVELLDGGTSGIELLGHIRKRDLLIIIDAMRSGQDPGTIVRVEGHDVPAVFRTRISPHQLGLSDLLAAAMLTDDLPSKLLLFGVEPARVDTGLELSEEVEMNLNSLLEKICEELKKAGCTVRSRDMNEAAKARFWDAA